MKYFDWILTFRFHFFLVYLQLRNLQAVLFIWFLGELVVIFSLLMMMESHHCSNACYKIMTIFISCMIVAYLILWVIKKICISKPWLALCRSALRTFKRRIVYSNVGYDRILSIWYFLLCFFGRYHYKCVFLFAFLYI